MKGVTKFRARVYTPRTKHPSTKAVNYIKRNIKDKGDED